MRYGHFEALEPLCPRCLHERGIAAPLKITLREEERGGDLWFGLLGCSADDCQLEFPVIDGVPLIVPDPAAVLKTLTWQVFRRDDLPPVTESLLGDAQGPGSDHDTTRQHLGLYAESHWGDWAGLDTRPGAVLAVARALDRLGDLPDGPVLDLGSGPGRTGWEIAARTGRTVLGVDLSLTFLRLAQRLRLEGRASFPRRRVGLVYDTVEAVLPESHATAPIDFWALDVQRLPFASGLAALVAMVNVVDCVPEPARLLAESARVAAEGAGGVVTTPFDWSPAATAPEGWFGGHSQRAPHAGAAEPVLRATLEAAGWEVGETEDGLPWHLRLHARSVMDYSLHMALLRRGE